MNRGRNRDCVTGATLRDDCADSIRSPQGTVPFCRRKKMQGDLKEYKHICRSLEPPMMKNHLKNRNENGTQINRTMPVANVTEA